MGRPQRGTYRGTNYSKSRNQNLPKKVDEEKKVSNIEMKAPTMGESVKSGFGFGLGSAVAHSTVAGLSSIVGGITGNIESEQGENQKLENCTGLLKKYVDCLQLHNYNDIQPECLEIKKMIETMKCNE